MRNPRLLLLGLVRLSIVIFITLISASFILAYHQEILELMWDKPASTWVLWLWHIFSWLLSLFLVSLATVLSYLISQILFSVLIMDYMSRITELKKTGNVIEPGSQSIFSLFLYLIKQEIPRTILPVLIFLIIMILGWLTPLGPVLAVFTSCMTVVFLAWDNSDLLPARRQLPFKKRFSFLLKTLSFHLGFGLLFLIPVANIFFLSFAPVGATLYHLDRSDEWGNLNSVHP